MNPVSVAPTVAALNLHFSSFKRIFLIPEKDWKTLSQYILDLAKSPILRQKFAMAGRKRIEQEFNVKINTAKLECLYDQVLASVM